MKLIPDAVSGPSISGYGPDWIGVGNERYQTSVLLSSAQGCVTWAVSRFEDIQAQDVAHWAQLKGELVIVGTGKRQRFLPPAWLAPLYSTRIGLETMDTAAACRTYNFLLGEGRRVVAALVLEPELEVSFSR